MDSRSFGNFLKEKLRSSAKQYEESLLLVNYKTMEEAKRIGGIREALIGIANSIDNLLEDFNTQDTPKI